MLNMVAIAGAWCTTKHHKHQYTERLPSVMLFSVTLYLRLLISFLVAYVVWSPALRGQPVDFMCSRIPVSVFLLHPNICLSYSYVCMSMFIFETLQITKDSLSRTHD